MKIKALFLLTPLIVFSVLSITAQPVELTSIGTNLFITNLTPRISNPGDLLRLSFDLAANNSNMKITEFSVRAWIEALTNGPLTATFPDGSTTEVATAESRTFDQFRSVSYRIPETGLNEIFGTSSEVDVFSGACETLNAMATGEFVWDNATCATPPGGSFACAYPGKAKADDITLKLEFQVRAQNAVASRSEVITYSLPLITPEACSK